jgi:hypothetical protein
LAGAAALWPTSRSLFTQDKLQILNGICRGFIEISAACISSFPIHPV